MVVALFSFYVSTCFGRRFCHDQKKRDFYGRGARASVAPSNGWSRKILGSHCDQTPPRNMLKFGQNVHLWRLHFLAFMPQPVSVAGFATTRRNVIFTDGVRSAGKRRFSRMASRYATKWLLQHPSGPPVCLPSSQQKRNRHFRLFRKNVDSDATDDTNVRFLESWSPTEVQPAKQTSLGRYPQIFGQRVGLVAKWQ